MEMLRGIVQGKIFIGLELSRVSFRKKRVNFPWGVSHGINSPEGIFCKKNFLLGGGVFAEKFQGGGDFHHDFKNNEKLNFFPNESALRNFF
jgi:hypothetical protein